MREKSIDRACVIGFKDLWLRIIGIPLISLTLPFIFFNTNPINDLGRYVFLVTVSIFYTFIYWHIDRGIVILFRKKIPSLDDYKKRLLIQSFVIILITVSLCSLIDVFTDYAFSNYLITIPRVSYFQSLSASLMITMVVILIYETTYAFDLFKEQLVRNESLKKKNAQAQLETLKNQVNPHFLFNSLNTLISVIPQNPSLAVKFVESLSLVYRYILEIKDKDLVSLNEELRCIEAYEYLLKIRFGENIRFTKTGFNGNRQRFLVPLSVQTLIENAIKHNIVSKLKPLEITIHADHDSLHVKNNLQLKSSIEESTKTGLENINKRFKILTNQGIKVIKTETEFEVIIPLIKIGKVT